MAKCAITVTSGCGGKAIEHFLGVLYNKFAYVVVSDLDECKFGHYEATLNFGSNVTPEEVTAFLQKDHEGVQVASCNCADQ